MAVWNGLSKCHRIYTSVISDQKLHQLKNKKKTLLNTSFLYIFQKPNSPFTLCHPILLKITNISQQLELFPPNYTQILYPNVRTCINIPKTTNVYTSPAHDAFTFLKSGLDLILLRKTVRTACYPYT